MLDVNGVGGIVSNFIHSITPAPPDHHLYVQTAFECLRRGGIFPHSHSHARQLQAGKCSNAVTCSHEASSTPATPWQHRGVKFCPKAGGHRRPSGGHNLTQHGGVKSCPRAGLCRRFWAILGDLSGNFWTSEGPLWSSGCGTSGGPLPWRSLAAPRRHPGSALAPPRQSPAAPRQHPGSTLAIPGSTPAAPRQHPGSDPAAQGW